MRVALFFDGKNFYRSMQGHDPAFEVSYDSLALCATAIAGGAGGQFVGAYYYTGFNRADTGARGDAFSRFLENLEYRRGFSVRREPRVRRRKRNGQGYYWTEKRVDTRLVADMIQLAAVDAYDCAVLFSGDQDLVPAVEAVQELGKQVWLGHWAGRGVPKELRKRCFFEIDLTQCVAEIGTGRARITSTAITTTTTTVEVVKTEIPAVIDVDALVISEVEKAAAAFAASGGHLSEWYFVNRWRGEPPCPPTGSSERSGSVERLVADGSLDVYEYDDAKERKTRAIRPATPVSLEDA